MSDGNGCDPIQREANRILAESIATGTMFRPSGLSPDSHQPRTTDQLSARERSKLTDAMITQIGELTKANNKLYAQLVASDERILRLEKASEASDAIERIDSLERAAALANTRMFWARLRWLLIGR